MTAVMILVGVLGVGLLWFVVLGLCLSARRGDEQPDVPDVVRRQSGALPDQLLGEDREHGPHDDGQDDPGAHDGDSEAAPIHLSLIGSHGRASGRVKTPCEARPRATGFTMRPR